METWYFSYEKGLTSCKRKIIYSFEIPGKQNLGNKTREIDSEGFLTN